MNYQRFLSQRKIQIGIVLLVTFLAFVNILQNQFVGDDFEFILGWQKAQPPPNIWDLAKGAVPTIGQHQGVYRPISNILGGIYFQWFGTNPFGYHAVALLVHLSITCLVFLIVERLTKKSLVAFVTSMLFGLHPVQVEAVASITPSIGLMGILFFFLSFYLYLKRVAKENTKISFLPFTFSLFTAFLAFLSYELTLMLPVLILLYHFLLLGRKTKEQNLAWPVLYFLPVAAYLFARFSFVGNVGRGEYFGGSLSATAVAMSKALLLYFKVLIFPFNLSPSYTFPGGVQTLADAVSLSKIPDVFKIDGWVFFSASIIAISLFMFFWFIKKYPLVSFSIAWFYLSLLPVSNIFPGVTLLAQRYLYIACFGIFLLLAFALDQLWNQAGKETRGIITFVATLIFLLLGSSTHFLNRIWHDQLTLWSYAVAKSPKDPASHYNLATVYQQEGKVEQAAYGYQKTLEFDPIHPGAHNNLAAYYFSIGNFDEAEVHYKKALEYGGEIWIVYYSLGNLYAQEGKLDLAKEYYKKAIDLNPDLKLDLDKLQKRK